MPHSSETLSKLNEKVVVRVPALIAQRVSEAKPECAIGQLLGVRAAVGSVEKVLEKGAEHTGWRENRQRGLREVDVERGAPHCVRV